MCLSVAAPRIPDLVSAYKEVAGFTITILSSVSKFPPQKPTLVFTTKRGSRVLLNGTYQ